MQFLPRAPERAPEQTSQQDARVSVVGGTPAEGAVIARENAARYREQGAAEMAAELERDAERLEQAARSAWREAGR